jgi:Ras-related protein Rab-5C
MVALNICKILLLGEMGVGKTSIARRLVFGSFGGEYKSTIGVEILTYEIANGPGGIPFTFLIWDTDGSYGEAMFDTLYMEGAQAALLVGDVSRRTTITSMVRLADAYAGRFPGRYSAVILNKMDLLASPDELSIPDGLETPVRKVLRTSAKTGEGVQEVFAEAAETIVRRGLLGL